MPKARTLCRCGLRHPVIDRNEIATLSKRQLQALLRRVLTADNIHVEMILRLRKAIEQHRDETWGPDGPIDHEGDLALYAVLTDDDLERSYRSARKAASATEPTPKLE